jgi:protein phosphatase PTC6
MVLVSDGISSVVSDQEIVDLARGAMTPKHAATRILSFAEEMGSSDNLTAIVLPFAGWGRIGGSDQTKKLREYRSAQMSSSIPLLFDAELFLIFTLTVGAERQKRM